MGMLDRVERRLDNMISGGFARAFKAELVPAEIAAELRRECDDTVVVRGQGRSVAANDYVVQMAPEDFDPARPVRGGAGDTAERSGPRARERSALPVGRAARGSA